MSAYEKYVEPAAKALDPDAYDVGDPYYASPAYGFRRTLACDRVRRVLATVGPLIAEDTRERMVAAAGRALERDDGVEWKATFTPCAVCAAIKPGDVDLFTELDKMADDEDAP